MPSNLPLSVVVVRWKNGPELRNCLESLLRAEGSAPMEIILVDSGSGDGGVEELRRDYPSVRMIELEENLGFGAAANRGVGLGSQPFIALLNPDTRMPVGSLRALVEGLGNSRAAGVVPLMSSPEGKSQARWQLRRLPRLWDLCCGRSGSPVSRNSLPAGRREIPQPAAAAWLLRREIWDLLEGFDERFRPAWWEDVDFCFRLRQLVETGEIETGFLLLENISVLHEGGSSLESMDRVEFLEIYCRNLLRFSKKHLPNRFGLIRSCLRFKLRVLSLWTPGLRGISKKVDHW